MSKKYLYNLEFHIEDTVYYEGYFISDKNLSEDDIKSGEDEYEFEAFEDMIESNAAIDVEEGAISDLEIKNKTVCSFTYNKYIPDSLYKSLHWFNKAISALRYNSISQKDLEQLLKEIKPIDCLRNEYDDSDMKETLAIRVMGNYMPYIEKRIRYCDKFLYEVVKILDIDNIYYYDSRISELLEQKKEAARQKQISCLQELIDREESLDERTVLSLRQGEQLNISDLINNVLYYAERMVLEIKFVLGDLVDVVNFNSSERITYFYGIYVESSFKDAILDFKRRLILERKCLGLRKREIGVTLTDIKGEKESAFDESEKEKIFKELCPLYKNEKVARRILDELDKYHSISITTGFSKRKLGVLIYLLRQCECFDRRLSFEKFKQKICAYYGKEDISIKPNKVRQEAIEEYNQRDFLYKGFGMVLHNFD